MRRALATLAVAAVAVTPVVSAAPADALYCGVLHPVCSTYCGITYDTLGWHCVD